MRHKVLIQERLDLPRSRVSRRVLLSLGDQGSRIEGFAASLSIPRPQKVGSFRSIFSRVECDDSMGLSQVSEGQQ